jgi:hypothetical protein
LLKTTSASIFIYPELEQLMLSTHELLQPSLGNHGSPDSDSFYALGLGLFIRDMLLNICGGNLGRMTHDVAYVLALP